MSSICGTPSIRIWLNVSNCHEHPEIQHHNIHFSLMMYLNVFDMLMPFADDV